MTYTHYQIRPGAYYDSVVLMQLQKSLAGLPGVIDAGVVMATPANCELLVASDFILDDIAAKPDDLLIIVRAESEASASAAMADIDQLLAQRRPPATHYYRPHSVKGAVQNFGAVGWVLISVPGRYAAGVADEALDLGKHVFLYSDNVPLDDEIRLKQKARAKGLLVMGPDCGTALINNVGFGFANRVRRGDIGIVAASGTGLQAASAEIHHLGGGVSQAFGTGGRDLKAEVGGITALQALNALARDEETAVILLISKPPAAGVAAELLRAAQRCGKPVVIYFMGYPPPGRKVGNLTFASSLTDAAENAVRLSRVEHVETPAVTAPLTGFVRGLFSGGTLAVEMLLGLQPVLAPLYSNLAADADRQLADLNKSEANTILDLGEDAFTQGRLHPMMDNDLRLRRMRREMREPEVDLILLDVVLGEGAHPDPAGELAPAISEARLVGKRVVAIVVGTEEDPQGLNSQIERLAAAGAVVVHRVSEALDYVYERIPPAVHDYPHVSLARGELAAINVGLEAFHDSILAQGGTVVQVDWRPPAGGNEKLMSILAKLKGDRPDASAPGEAGREATRT